jgi:molybdopterin molybdotransferase
MKATSPRILSPQDPEVAFAWIERVDFGLGAEMVRRADAAGRMLAEPLLAQRGFPDRVQSIREGYAVRSADTVGASDYSPLLLRPVDDGQSIGADQCVRVAAAQSLPAAADAVLGLDAVQVVEGYVEVSAAVAPGDGVLMQGAQCTQGQGLFESGRILRPVDLALLRMAGVDAVSVRRLPRVMIVGVTSHSEPAVEMVRASVGCCMGATCVVAAAPDIATLEQLVAPAEADLVLFVGGSGVEESDIAWRMLSDAGAIDIDGVAIHPGAGVALGRLEQCPYMLLPGGPVAGFAAFELLGERLLRRAGCRADQRAGIRILPLARKLVSRIGLLEMARVRISDGMAHPLATQEDQLLQTITGADGFVLIPPASEGFPAGSDVHVHCFEPRIDPQDSD